MQEGEGLTRSITTTLVSLVCCQMVITLATGLLYRLSGARVVFFLAVILLYHGLLLFAMLALKRLFVLEESGIPLRRVNVSNVLSIIRLSSVPAILFLILSAREAPLVPVILPILVLIFLTDFFDGRLARRLGQITRMGLYLDAFSDYLILSATLFVFLWYGLIPVWFFVLVVIRLAVVVVGNTTNHIIRVLG